MENETVTTNYVAEKLHCSVGHANLLCRQGRIKAVKPFDRWLVDKASFDAKFNGEENGTNETGTYFDI